uniref:Secreted protein n=1 Tax=Panstrongylus lignarius TaxID=156445 RepID=A0A224XZ50_9HEMI
MSLCISLSVNLMTCPSISAFLVRCTSSHPYLGIDYRAPDFFLLLHISLSLTGLSILRSIFLSKRRSFFSSTCMIVHMQELGKYVFM